MFFAQLTHVTAQGIELILDTLISQLIELIDGAFVDCWIRNRIGLHLRVSMSADTASTAFDAFECGGQL